MDKTELVWPDTIPYLKTEELVDRMLDARANMEVNTYTQHLKTARENRADVMLMRTELLKRLVK